jgi:cell division septal protein FtsQ
VSTVSAPSDRRFRRAHLKPGRRRPAWRALIRPVLQYGVIGAVLLYGLYRATAVAAYAHVLRIGRIDVAGNERLSKGEVLAVLNGMHGESILWTDLDAWRNRLLTSPWVRDAALRRSLPSTVEVVITERQPIGIGRINGAMYLVDARGVVIDEYGPQYSDLDLPIIDGLGGKANGHAAPETMTDESRADLAARVIGALKAKPTVATLLSQVDVSDVHNASVILTGDPAVIHVGEDQFLPRIESYLELAAAVHERVAEIDYVDLRFDDRIYVRPAKVTPEPAVKIARAERPAFAKATADKPDGAKATAGKPDGGSRARQRRSGRQEQKR